MRSSLAATVLLLAAALPDAAKTYDVMTYGGNPDGTTMDTAAIQRAIDDAPAHGGTEEHLAPQRNLLPDSFYIPSTASMWTCASTAAAEGEGWRDDSRGGTGRVLTD
jgi:hypothetical protein